MKATEILGPKAMTFLEWVDKFKGNFQSIVSDYAIENELTMAESRFVFIIKAHQLFSQPFYIELAKKAFEGEWSQTARSYWIGKPEEISKRVRKIRIKTLDDFIRECQREGIELFYHKDYEI